MESSPPYVPLDSQLNIRALRDGENMFGSSPSLEHSCRTAAEVAGRALLGLLGQDVLYFALDVNSLCMCTRLAAAMV